MTILNLFLETINILKINILCVGKSLFLNESNQINKR